MGDMTKGIFSTGVDSAVGYEMGNVELQLNKNGGNGMPAAIKLDSKANIYDISY